MKKILFLLMITLTGCKGPAGPTGPAGTNGTPGTPGDAIPTLQMLFKTGESPDSNYAGLTQNRLDRLNPTTAYTDDGYIRLAPGASDNPSRVLLHWDLTNYIPSTAVITNAVLQIHSLATSSYTSAVTLGIFNMGTSQMVDSGSCLWTTSASWQYYDSVNTWDTCGGTTTNHVITRGFQYPTTPMSTAVLLAASSGADKLIAFNLDTSMVQRWVSETGKNNGIIITSVNEWAEAATGHVDLCVPTSPAAYRASLIVNYYIP